MVGRARATRSVSRGRGRRRARPTRVRRRAGRAAVPAPRCGTCSSSARRSCATRSARLLRLEPPDEAFGPYASSAGSDAPVPVRASGPVITSLDELPGVEFEGDRHRQRAPRQPARSASRASPKTGGPKCRVGIDDAGDFVEVVVPALPADAAALERVTAGLAVAVGDRLPIPRGLDDWLRRVATALRRGYVVLIDTMDTAAGMLARGPDEWLRTYRGQTPIGGPLVEPGSRDLVADVVVEQLRHAASDAGFTVLAETTQSAWLDDLGIAVRVDEGRRALGRTRRRRRPRRARGAQPRDAGRGAHRPRGSRRPPRRRAGPRPVLSR